MRLDDHVHRFKRKFDKPAPSVHPIPVRETWKKVGIDLIESLASSSGNRYCVTLIDYFSKWTVCKNAVTTVDDIQSLALTKLTKIDVFSRKLN